MGYKSKSNYAPGYSMTDEEFNKIFKKDKDADTKLKIKKEREYYSITGDVEEES